MNGHDWTDRYALIVRDGAKIKSTAILDAEVVCADSDGKPDFDLLHSRCNDDVAVACAFDLLMLEGEDFRRHPFALRKAMLRKLLKAERVGLQYVEHIEGDATKCLRPCASLAWKASCQRNWTRLTDLARRRCGSRSKTRRRQRQRASLREAFSYN
jgi:bifunctional non-homologous end joining protein LigD